MAQKAPARIPSNNTIETDSRPGDYGRDFATTVKDEVVKKSMAELWKQFFGNLEQKKDRSPQREPIGDMAAGVEIVFTKKTTSETQKPAEQIRRPDIAPALNYHAEMMRSGEQLSRKESREIEYKIQEIIVELKRLIDSSEFLQLEFRQISVEQAPVTPGRYHVNFFDWMLTIIRAARMKVEDGGAWLGVMKGKKGQNYWGMFKKQGTSFSQSNERNVATQSG